MEKRFKEVSEDSECFAKLKDIKITTVDSFQVSCGFCTLFTKLSFILVWEEWDVLSIAFNSLVIKTSS